MKHRTSKLSCIFPKQRLTYFGYQMGTSLISKRMGLQHGASLRRLNLLDILIIDGHQFAVYTYLAQSMRFRTDLLFLVLGRLTLPYFVDKWFAEASPPVPLQQRSTSLLLSLNVRPLPEGAPSGFGGAVGTFSIEVRPLSLELELGGSLTVETRITGSGISINSWTSIN